MVTTDTDSLKARFHLNSAAAHLKRLVSSSVSPSPSTQGIVATDVLLFGTSSQWPTLAIGRWSLH